MATITGTTDDDLLFGTTGADTMQGLAGDDILSGDLGNDTLDGGLGADVLTGGDGNDTFIIDSINDTVNENVGEGTDAVQSSVTITALYDNVENLTLTGAAALNGTGNELNNLITGNSAVNTLDGSYGDDTLDGGTGNDKLIGGYGDDTFIVDVAGDVIVENAGQGNDTVKTALSFSLATYANIENITLTGAAAANATGNALDNVLTGNSAANTLDGKVGADTMVGGGGNDTYIVDDVLDVVTEGSNAGTDTVSSSVAFDLSVAGANVENLTLTGALSINGTGNALANIITGNTGNNTIDGGAGNDTMIGGTGNDTYIVDSSSDVVTELASGGTDTVLAGATYSLATLAAVENLTLTGTGNFNATGNALVNTLTGNTGNNFIDGGAGNDTMIGGDGNDSYVVDSTTDVITELASQGTDSVSASASYTLGLNIENLVLTGTAAINGTGNALDNTITGNSGNNTLDGGTGNDVMTGGAGNDTYIIDGIGDDASEASGQGTDTVITTVEGYLLQANIENDTLGGTTAHGIGNTLDNVMTGNAASNTLDGLAGNDTLDGGAGADTLNGGTGNDTYVVDNSGDIVNEASGEGTDTINATASVDISGSDAEVEIINLLGTAAINATGSSSANTITGNTAGNILSGGDGNDTLDGGTGADTMIGGDGNDTFKVDNVSDVVTEASGEGTDTVISTVNYTLGANVDNLTLTGTTALIANGNADVNILTGNAGNNTLDGKVGADTMVGGLGNDIYFVDDLLDVVTESASGGTDTVSANITYTLASAANVENLTLTGTAAIDGTGNSGVNVITGNSGNNTLDGGTGVDTLIGGAGNDTYVVDVVGDVITEAASAGNDTVSAGFTYSIATLTNLENITLTGTGNFNATGNTAVNILTGNAGNNTLDGGTGADTMIGGDGNDTYVVDNAGDVITEATSGGTDTVLSAASYVLSSVGEIENLTLTGTAAINGTGNALDNTINGNTANNTLDGGAGADTLAGGTGNDTYIVDNASDFVTELTGAGTDAVLASVDYTLGSFIENLTLTGSAAEGTGNTLDNIMTGSSGANTLSGLGGNDTFIGGGGADTLVGGAGNDLYIIGNAGVTITEVASEGTDTVQASVSVDLSTMHEVEIITLTGTSAINATGTDEANTITGNTAINVLSGGDGNDTLDGGTGADTMIGGDGNDTFTVDNIADVVTEASGEGNDTVISSVTYTLGANVDNLTLTGTTALNGTGNADVNILTGNGGNNTLDGKVGADTMIGGAGNDTYIVDDVGDVITEGSAAGTDTVLASSTFSLATFANVENLTLTGALAIDGTGNALNNVITGNSAANTIDGGLGNDTMIGGAGNDVYIVNATLDVITEVAAGGTDEVQSTVTYSLETFTQVENLTLTGSANINGTGNALVNVMWGNTGNNTIDGGAGADTMTGNGGNDTYIIDNVGDTVDAGSGIDTYLSSVSYTIADIEGENLTLIGAASINATGNNAANILTGNTGANVLDDGGSGAADTLIGGAGNDTYVIHNAGDVITEITTGGTDTAQTYVNYTIGNFVENLTLMGSGNINGTGNSGNNIITGNSGDNSLDGGGGNDAFKGGLGNDHYFIDSTTDIVTEKVGEGHDTIHSSVSYTLSANVEELILTGSGNINATGSSGDDTLTGNTGDNVIYGAAGNDILTGDIGNDTFMFKAATAFVGQDHVTDFDASHDVLDISNILTGYTGTGGQVLTDYVSFNDVGSDTEVWVDKDGAGTTYSMTKIATLDGVTGLDEATLVATAHLLV